MSDQTEYRKTFERERKRLYRKKRRTFTVVYGTDIAKQLRQKADEYNTTIPEYIKKIVDANLNGNGYVVPPEYNIQQLIIAFRKIGNNINQVVRHINSSREVSFSDIEQLQHHLSQLEAQIIQALTCPPQHTDDNKAASSQDPRGHK